jgi:hypothetical protein
MSFCEASVFELTGFEVTGLESAESEKGTARKTAKIAGRKTLRLEWLILGSGWCVLIVGDAARDGRRE